jgi:succinoglycan biosynthesis transport protein ExoP
MNSSQHHFSNQNEGVAQANKLSSALQTMSGLELRTMFGMIVRQWRLILATLILVLLITLGIISQMSYRYTAEALLSIDQRESQLVGQEDVVTGGVTLNNRVDTEVEILGSTSVALGVVDRLALWRDPEFGFTGLSRLDSLKGVIGMKLPIREGPEATRLSELAPELQSQLVKKLGSAVKIARRGLTSVISIQTTSKDAEKSALIANAMAESYLDVQINAKAKTAQSAADFLSAKVDELAKNIQSVDSKVENFILEQSDAIGTPEARAELTRMREQINLLSNSQEIFSTELAQLQSLQDNPGSIVPNAVSAELRALAEKRAELAKLSAEAAAPPDVTQQLAAIDKQLRQSASVRTASLKDELGKSDKQKEALRKQLQELFGHQEIPNEIAINLYRLQREAESSRKLYETYSTRLGEVQQQVSLALPNTRIVAPAIIPFAPSYPPSSLLLALASLLGLGLGAAAAIAREHLVGGFASPGQVEAVTGLGVMSAVPGYDGTNPQNAILDVPFSGYSESIRRMRIGIENAIGPLPSKVIVVTSTEPSEGKSTLSISVARAFASSGRSTILIDSDFRHPSVAKLTGFHSRGNLIELLPEIKADYNLSTIVETELDSNLSTLTTTATTKQASDVLVGSAQFLDLITAARAQFEFVIIDCPPIGYVVDAKIVSRNADLVLYVVKQNSTSQQDAVSGLRQMVGAGQAPVALVLNNVRDILGGYYYRNSRYNNYYKSEV